MANEFIVRKGLIVEGASGGTVVDVQGSQGQLFSVTDDLSGSIFAVSDISGVPIFDVNSSGVSYFDGNVGIGTTAPKGKLHVLEGAAGTYTPSSESDTLVVESATPGGISLIGTGAGGNSKQSIVFGKPSDANMASIIYDGNSSFLSIGTSTTSNYVRFTSGNSVEAMRIAASGNVGIGTTNPIDKLNVDGGTGDAVAQQPKIAVTRTSSTGNVLAGKMILTTKPSDATNHGNLVFQVKTTASSGESSAYYTDAITIDGNSANVGIGTTAPNRNLHVIGQIALDNAATNPSAGMLITADGTSNKIYSRTANNNTTPLAFEIISGASSSLYITSGGNVGIGTTAPNEELEVRGSSFTSIAVTSDRNTINENIGSFAFYGRNDNATPETLIYSRIMAGMPSVTDGAESGNIFFQQINAGTIQETFGVTSTGSVRFNQYGAGTLVTDASGNITVSSGGGAGGPYLPLSAGSSYPLTDTLYITKTGASHNLILTNNTAGGDYIKCISETGDTVFELDSGGTGGEASLSMYSDGVLKNSIQANGNTYFNNIGNVGIGTTSPNEKLQVVGNIQGGGVDQASNKFNTSAIFRGQNDGAAYINLIAKDDANSGILLGVSASGVIDSYVAGFLYNNATNSLNIHVNNQNAIVIDSSQQVGINVSAPTERLHVVGNARVTGAYYDSSNSAGTAGQILSSTATGTDWIAAPSAGSTVYTPSVFEIKNSAITASQNRAAHMEQTLLITGSTGVTIATGQNVALTASQAGVYEISYTIYLETTNTGNRQIIGAYVERQASGGTPLMLDGSFSSVYMRLGGSNQGGAGTITNTFYAVIADDDVFKFRTCRVDVNTAPVGVSITTPVFPATSGNLVKHTISFRKINAAS